MKKKKKPRKVARKKTSKKSKIKSRKKPIKSKNEQLINVRETFDQYNLISALHSYLSLSHEKYKNLLPPLVLLPEEKCKELVSKLEGLKFNPQENLAA